MRRRQVFLRDQVLEFRNVEGLLHVAKKERGRTSGNPPITPYDRYGPGDGIVDECCELVRRRVVIDY